MKGRFLSLLTALCLMLTLVPAALADEAPADTEPVPCTLTEGCTLNDGHEGECAVPAQEAQEPAEEAIPAPDAPAEDEGSTPTEPVAPEEIPLPEEPAEVPAEEPVVEEPVVEEPTVELLEESSAWDGSTLEDIPRRSGIYEITTGAQLAQLAKDVNGGNSYQGKTVVVMNDIDLGGYDFTPIGTRSKPFKGTLTGVELEAGVYPSISNASVSDTTDIINVGVIGFVNGGTVENLNFASITVKSTASKSPDGFDNTESTTGVAVGALDGGTIRNVIVQSSCSVEGNLRTGGISGDISNNGTIIDCKNYAAVTGSDDYTGGITGAAHNAPTTINAYGAVVSGCENYGEVQGTSAVGGIVGYADRAKISGCKNAGEITGTGNYGTGGIVGANSYNVFRYLLVTRRPTVASVISACTNSGSVNAPRAGGILGTYYSAPGDDQPDNLLNCTITNCSNSGTITGTNGKIGAIFGYQISYAKGDGDADIYHMGIAMSGCTNTGSPSNLSGSNVAVTEVQ